MDGKGKWYENYYKTQSVGSIRKEIEQLLEITVEEKVISIYPSTLKHIRKKHPHAYREYMKKLPEILEYPDYVGISFEYPIRLEFIKQYKESLLVALKLDKQGKLYVSSMYIIDEARIQKRESYGRIKKVDLKKKSIKYRGKYKNYSKKQ